MKPSHANEPPATYGIPEKITTNGGQGFTAAKTK